MAVFCQIVDSGNYQKASEVLNVTPSALSQTVTTLEYSLGFLLFDRRGKKLVPTVQGLHLHKEFQSHHFRFLQTIQDLKGQKKKIAGILRVGSYQEFAKSHLIKVIKNFLDEYPDTQIKMTFDTPTRLHNLLMQGQLDLCFSIYPSHETKMIRSQSVFEEELVLIAPKSLFAPIQPSFDQLMKTPMIEYYLNHQPIRQWIYLNYQKRPKKIPVRTFAATAEMVLALVKSGVGIGVVPAYLVNSVEMQKTIRIIRPTVKKLTDYIWMLEKVSLNKPLIMTVFQDRVLQNLKSEIQT